MTDAPRYAIGDLADLGGVSRRTVRYYVQEGLLPQPLGVGRGNHYSTEHLDQLVRVKALQEAGRTLDEIRRELGRRTHQGGAARMQQSEAPLPRTLWRRIMLAPGVELHVSGNNRLPSPTRLGQLATWCRLHCPGEANGDDDADD
jgi:DNA-binding transcriptional MerR regulator